MNIAGIVLMIIGIIGFLLIFTGVAPGVANLGVPIQGWAGAAIAGFLVWMFTRRARD